MPASNPLTFYASHSPITDPGDHAGWLGELPRDIPSLVQIVQGLMLHPFSTRLYEVDMTSVQRSEIHLRTVREMLAKLRSLDDTSPLEPRPVAERLAGTCRDFSVLMCALARQVGIPARVRVGFTSIFLPRLNCYHWLSEVWDAAQARWVLLDAQMDDVQRAARKIEFDTLDIPDGIFFHAGQAWQACRAERERSSSFGVSQKQYGWLYLRGALLQDLAVMNKIEVLPWDVWWDLGAKKEDTVTPEDRAFLDRLADMTLAGNARFDDLRSAYEDEPQFVMPVQSRMKLLGLGNGAKASAGVTLLPADSQRLPNPLQVERSTLNVKDQGPQVSSFSSTFNLPPATFNSVGYNAADKIIIRGAQQHNLKHIDLTLPRNRFVVLTGVSGSGKSSLAFDTLYAEGQRRYVESLSSYVRRYLDQMDKPKVDYIGGLSPAIAIEQKSVSKNPRSTVGTITEVMDYLRVLFSRAGTQHCPQCGRAVEPVSPQIITDRLRLLPPGTRFQLLAPLTAKRKTDVAPLLRQAFKDGYSRARVDGQTIDLSAPLPAFDKTQKHTVHLVIDRLVIPTPEPAAFTDSSRSTLHAPLSTDFLVRLIDSVETALRAGGGVLLLELLGEAGAPAQELLLSEHNRCPYCEISLPMLSASLFSFNAPAGMCHECNGLGVRLEVDPALIVDHPELSLMDGASRWYGNLRKKKSGRSWLGNLQTLAQHYSIDLDTPWQDLPQSFRDVILYGSGEEKIHFTYESRDASFRGEADQVVKGLVFHIHRLFRQTHSEGTRRWYTSFMSQQPCPTCGGSRLCAEARTVSVGGRTFPEVLRMNIAEAHTWVLSLAEGAMNSEQIEIVGEILKELRDRLQFMLNVGLHYLTLERPAPTLSGGEGQRIRLASSLGCGLVGVLYILDEPSIGLHSRDQRNLLQTLFQLRDMGNTVLVVEHDAETMQSADWLVDLGPGAGVMGGEVVAAGTPAEVMANPASLTGRYLSGALQVTGPDGGRRSPTGWITLRGARLFNLKNLTARFPLGVMTCVTGVSGSGKSSLVAETLNPALERALNGAQANPGPYDRLEGLEALDKVINITQDPIGRTPRSNPATYVGVFDLIRQVFASTPEARARGYKADRFSFNVKGGRCEACRGHGQKKIEMHFLPDVWVTCQECKGTRYNRHTLDVHYKGKNIAQVLDMDVQQALAFFGSYPIIHRILQTLHDVGLDYVKLGQSANTLSGGEAQRVKLASELCRTSTGKTVYILDEPTTGLHFADIQRLLDVLHRLVNAGNTVIVIEHNLDVIKTADWIIDLGPEGGMAGGYIVAEGTPEAVAVNEASATGMFLREVLVEVSGAQVSSVR